MINENRIPYFITLLMSFFFLAIGLLINERVLIPWLIPHGDYTLTSRYLLSFFSYAFIALSIVGFLFGKKKEINFLLLNTFVIFLTFLVLDLIISKGAWFKARALPVRNSHALLHHANSKNATGPIEYLDRKIMYYTNSLGYRDSKIRNVEKKTSAKERVVFFGDSWTEAVGIDYLDAYPHLFESIANQNNRQIEVLNGGVHSHSPFMYYRRLKIFLDEGYTTDKVIVMLDPSDIHDEGWFLANTDDTSVFSSQPESLFSYIFPTISGMIAKIVTSKFPGKLADLEISLQIKKGGLAKYDGILMGKSMTEYQAQFENEAKATKETTLVYVRGHGTDFPKLYADYGKKGIERTEQYFIKIAELCKKNNIQFYIGLYPWPYHLRFRDKPQTYKNTFLEMAKRNRFQVMDFFAPLMEIKNWQDYYLDSGQDVHVNEKGHAVVAQAMYKMVYENNAQKTKTEAKGP